MLPWQSRESNSYGTASTQGGAAAAASGGSTSSGFAIPHLSWLPTVTSQSHGQRQSQSQSHVSDSQGTIGDSYPSSYRNQLQHHHHHPQTPQHQTYQTHGSASGSVSNSRGGRPTPQQQQQQQQSQPQSLAVLIDPPPRESSAEASEHEDQSEAGSNARDNDGVDAGDDPEYSPSQSGAEDAESQLQREEARHAGGVAGSTTARRASTGRAAAAPSSATANAAVQDNRDNVTEKDGPRRSRQRLRTYEEVALFRICNRHADTFGRRSNLCQWWKDVTAQFVQEEGHQYSWHSVRRKVENVMKQRIKFLEDQKNGVAAEDRSNPQWREAVEAFIPAWRRWEEAEAGRIESRDAALQGRKRKSRTSLDVAGRASVSYTPDKESSRIHRPSLPSSTAQPGTSPQQQQRNEDAAAAAAVAPGSAPQPPPSNHAVPTAAAAARLPPGFGSMFQSSPYTTPAISRYGYGMNSPPATDGVLAAILETLNKLNERLDGGVTTSMAPASAAATTTRPANDNNPSSSSSLSTEDIEKLKAELRREVQAELRRELEKDREKIDSVQRTQEMILEMLRQEPS